MEGHEFSEAGFERKLVELRESQKEIQTVSSYCIHHRAHHKMMVKVWYRNLKQLSTDRKLCAMYLANDVVQNGRKKGPEFAREFGTVMRRVFEHLATMNFDEKTVSR
jgi:regulator of Ty1 transposition protein 103